jgi:hypothetical protein
VRVRLHPVVSAPGAAGAFVIAQAQGEQQTRMLVAGGQPFSQGEEVIDFAWPDARSTDLTIHWPSGAVQSIAGVPARSTLDVVEPQWLHASHQRLVVNVAQAQLGHAGSVVVWSDGKHRVEARADAAGIARLELPAPATIGQIVIDDHAVGARPAVDMDP